MGSAKKTAMLWALLVALTCAPGSGASMPAQGSASAASVMTLTIVLESPVLNTTATVISRIVTTKSGCTVKVVGAGRTENAAGTSGLTLNLSIDRSLGPEAFSASYDGATSAKIHGGDVMGVLYGAGAFLRAAQYSPTRFTPPRPLAPQPPVPISSKWYPGLANQSYCYAQTQPDGEGTDLVPLLGIFDTFEECKAACVSGRAISPNQTLLCTACGWGDTQNLGVFRKHCYARHDTVWQPGPVTVPGAMWARRYVLPLPPTSPAPPSPNVPWAAADKPAVAGNFRGLYFATHFGNFFANAPPSDVHEYIEEMGLWGANTLILCSEAAKFESFDALTPLLDRNARIGAYAQSIGFKVGWIFNNEGFENHPLNISYTRPVGDRGDFSPLQELVCPAKGLAYLLDDVWGRIMQRIKANGLSLDHLIAWPYDWGGCGCSQDWPWGSVGFPRFSTAVLGKAQSTWGHPKAKGTVSTWHFQLSSADEYGGLDKWLRANPKAGFTHAMSAVMGGWDWLQQHGQVGNLPTLDFPEYSMFGRCPWGGYGANPIPASIQADWDNHGQLIDGGMPYSEGIYLDINQVLRQRMYWAGLNTTQAVREYAAYEYGRGAVDQVVLAVGILEQTYSGVVGSSSSQQALDLLDDAGASMTATALTSWRWRILYLRALIDAAAYNQSHGIPAGDILNRSFAELDAIYHVNRNCIGSSGKLGARELFSGSNCTIAALRPGFPEPGASAECSDVRLKRDVRQEGVSPIMKIPIFSWIYRDGFGLDSSRRYRGTTAQALLETGRLDAVVLQGPVLGFMGVDYSKLDISFGASAQPNGW